MARPPRHCAPHRGPDRGHHEVTAAQAAFFEFDAAGLEAWCGARGMPKFAAKQLMDWVYGKGVVDIDRMTNLSKANRDMLAHEMVFLQGSELRNLEATDGTRKLLIGWPAPGGESVSLPVLGVATGRETECVMIPSEERRTACVSSQMGCPVGCKFCASGLEGVEGNLTTGRIVEQVWRLAQQPGVGRISNVVFMGMGEPLANANAVMNAIRTLNAPWGMGISARKITVSTVGLPAAIRKLCDFELPVTLALSLHAPTDELRRQIIPWAEYSTVSELLGACQEYFAKTGREITLEYILLGGFNDQREQAEELARIARTIRANVNLIRYNEVDGLPFARPDDRDVLAFQGVLRDAGVNTHIRASRGRDIKAACGQLRHEAMKG
ncbi:MAG: 23S rRNA (adenine(2503)-C(2))-methyltransferase RlmN [Proteobacteria bacterium]|nr:23S rRNA (adenine(2503)-C(2))-methyltransferase RlmN [Pseudomonadota bacterium]